MCQVFRKLFRVSEIIQWASLRVWVPSLAPTTGMNQLPQPKPGKAGVLGLERWLPPFPEDAVWFLAPMAAHNHLQLRFLETQCPTASVSTEHSCGAGKHTYTKLKHILKFFKRIWRKQYEVSKQSHLDVLSAHKYSTNAQTLQSFERPFFKLCIYMFISVNVCYVRVHFPGGQYRQLWCPWCGFWEPNSGPLKNSNLPNQWLVSLVPQSPFLRTFLKQQSSPIEVSLFFFFFYLKIGHD